MDEIRDTHVARVYCVYLSFDVNFCFHKIKTRIFFWFFVFSWCFFLNGVYFVASGAASGCQRRGKRKRRQTHVFWFFVLVMVSLCFSCCVLELFLFFFLNCSCISVFYSGISIFKKLHVLHAKTIIYKTEIQ